MARYRNSRSANGFMRRNAAYFIMIACVILTALIIIFASSSGKTTGGIDYPDNVLDPIPDQQVTGDPEVFVLPVVGARLGYTYNVEVPVKLSVEKNSMATWVLFTETEFIAAEGTPVVAVYNGKVLSVVYDITLGTMIEIEHEDGLTSTYKYMQKDAAVKKGDTVKSGDLIGHIGVSYNYQYNIGPHLCFGLLRDNKPINPAEYLEI